MSNIIRLFPDVMAPYHIEEPPLTGAEMEAKAFREQVVRPALLVCDLHSQAAENLLVATALTESGLSTLKQLGMENGALSFYQIEKLTYDDVQSYLKRKPKLRATILAACYMDMFPPFEALAWHLRLATLIARIIYYRRPEPLPRADNPKELYDVYKRVYNTELGKATWKHSETFFISACST